MFLKVPFLPLAVRISTGAFFSFRLFTLLSKSAAFESQPRSCAKRKNVFSAMRKLLKLRALSLSDSKKESHVFRRQRQKITPEPFGKYTKPVTKIAKINVAYSASLFRFDDFADTIGNRFARYVASMMPHVEPRRIDKRNPVENLSGLCIF